MSKFKKVNVVREANIYYDGKVTSRTVEFKDGSVKSLGIMLEGDYRFNTAKAEVMEILSGKFKIKLEGSKKFIKMKAPCFFEVEADSYFDIKVKGVVDYCCSYID